LSLVFVVAKQQPGPRCHGCSGLKPAQL